MTGCCIGKLLNSLPSAAAFDTLFKRLELGDLGELDPAKQDPLLAQLKQLLPAGDEGIASACSDTQRCWSGVQQCYNQEAIRSSPRSRAFRGLAGERQSGTAIRFFYCCSGNYHGKPHHHARRLADFDHGIELARGKATTSPCSHPGLQLRGGAYLGARRPRQRPWPTCWRRSGYSRKMQLDEAANQTLQNIGVAYRRLELSGQGTRIPGPEHRTRRTRRRPRRPVRQHPRLGYADQEAGNSGKALASQQRGLEIATALGDQFGIGSANPFDRQSTKRFARQQERPDRTARGRRGTARHRRRLDAGDPPPVRARPRTGRTRPAARGAGRLRSRRGRLRSQRQSAHRKYCGKPGRTLEDSGQHSSGAGGVQTLSERA